MKEPAAQRLLALLAALSHQTDFSVGCYCENADRCHRSILSDLLAEQGAVIHKDDLDHFAGTWSEDEAKAFDAALAEQRGEAS